MPDPTSPEPLKVKSLGGFMAPSYFGALAPTFVDTTGYKPDIPDDQAHGDTAILQWVYEQIHRTGWFSSVAIGRNPGRAADGVRPRAWVYPLGFSERNSASDLSTRQTTITVVISVDTDRDGDTLPGYRQLEDLTGRVCDLVEEGPDWCNPSAGGLQQGRYEPPDKRGDYELLFLTLNFAYSWDREK